MLRGGTFTILYTLIRAGTDPLYEPMRWRLLRRRGRADAVPEDEFSVLVTFFGVGRTLLGLYMGFLTALGVCGGLILLVAWATEITLVWTTVVIGLLVISTGLITVAAGISRAIGYEQRQRTWGDLLMLPYPRQRIVLHSIEHAYTPLLSLVALVIILIVTTLALQTSMWRMPGLYGALLVEWFQLQALGVSLGVMSACRSHKDTRATVPALVGTIALLGRSVVGWLIATLPDAPGNLRSFHQLTLLIGPAGGVVAGHSGLAITVLYLLALEIVVRVLFAWSVAHIGDE